MAPTWEIMTMKNRSLFSGAALAILLSTGAASAVEPVVINECPAEHRLSAPRELKAPPDEGTVREVKSFVPLDGWRGVEALALRIRKLTVVPGGFVPLHWHDDRPTVDYIIKGELIEHNSFCAVPIVHHEGDSASRFGIGVAHWWKNETDSEVILVSADVVPLDKVNY